MNVARLIALLAHLPIATAGTTVNRFCGSSMQAIHMAAGAIQLDAGEVFVCAGVESMTRVQIGGFNFLPNPRLVEEYPQAYMSMGETAENVAKKYQITRDDQDAFAVQSHRKAAAAQAEGRFKDEIVPIRRNGEAIEPGRLHPPRHQQGGARRAEAGVRRARHGHRRHLLAAHRRRGGGPGVHRGLRREARPRRAGADPERRGRGLRGRDHGHRAGRGDPQGARARRAGDRRHRGGRAQRGVRLAGDRLRARPDDRSRHARTSTAARSRSATRSARPAPGSPARRRRS